MYTTIGTYYSFYMTVCCPGWIRTIQPGQQTKYTKNKLCIKLVFLYTNFFRCSEKRRNLYVIHPFVCSCSYPARDKGDNLVVKIK